MSTVDKPTASSPIFNKTQSCESVEMYIEQWPKYCVKNIDKENNIKNKMHKVIHIRYAAKFQITFLVMPNFIV